MEERTLSQGCEAFREAEQKMKASQLGTIRSRQSSSAPRISDDQIIDLVTKLRQILPEIGQRRRSDKVSASKVLQETCNYIRNLNREVDNLSERLAQLLESVDEDSPQAAVIRSLLM
ncbi:hypothetical protein Bca4012_099267 [Brassica carinata]